MNARQKAKKYKRMYEMALTKTPIKFEINQHKIDTLRFEKYYPIEFVLGNWNKGCYLRKVVIREIADSFADRLADNLDKYVNYITEYCPDLDKYRFIGEIKIVERS